MLKYLLVFFILLIALSIIRWVIRRYPPRRLLGFSIYGSNENIDQKVYYHGSSKIIDVLEPRPSGVINNEKAVFATSSYTDAVIFSTLWSDYNFSFGTYNGDKYLIEMYPGAFEKLNTTGYIHHVPANKFHHDKRTGLNNEFISFHPVKPLTYDTVNVKDYLSKSDVQMITYDKYVKLLHESPKVKFAPSAQLKKIKEVIIPIDQHWSPSIDDKHVIYFDRLSPKEISRELKKYTKPKSVIVIGNVIAPPYYLYDFGETTMSILSPPEGTFLGNQKTLVEEYKKYIKLRESILEFYAERVG